MCRWTMLVVCALVWGATIFTGQAEEPPSDNPRTQSTKPDDVAAKPAAKLRSADLERVLPRWNLRDEWTVETVTKRMQKRKPLEAGALVSPIQWRFAVSKFEKTLGADCFRIEVDCLARDDGHPRSVLWFDRQSLALRRMATEFPTRSGYRVITASYVHDPDQPSPVVDMAAALPIAAPLFHSRHAKGIDRFEYRTVFNPEEKALDDTPFSHAITQSARKLSPKEARAVIDGVFAGRADGSRFAKSLSDEGAIEVVLKSGPRQIRQLWQQQKPWPVFCDNGYSACQLISTKTANDHENQQSSTVGQGDQK